MIASGNKDRTPHLIWSVPCGPGVIGCTPNGAGRRGWAVAKEGVEAMDAIKDARSVSFLDMDEDVSTYLRGYKNS